MEQLVGMASVPRATPAAAMYAPDVIRATVRDALLAAGLGAIDRDAPLADVIRPGMSVLVKPNWVLHVNTGGYGMDCMVTHPSFVEAVLDEVLRARPGRVIVGDAPIQSCRFDLLVDTAWRARLCRRAPDLVEIRDFRRTIAADADLSRGVRAGTRPLDAYVLFDLGADSLLEPVSTAGGGFRVTSYDPDAIARTHAPGRHQFLLCREALEADVVINLPKLKTHRKAGLTGALKNLVGINGSKEYLPHHRAGGTARGGDCYPGRAPLNGLAELCLDHANRRINGGLAYNGWSRLGLACQQVQRAIGDADLEGGWHGNDTTWRMVIDINRLFLYGRRDGTISDCPQRTALSLTDAVVAGQGEGPLAPHPLPLGLVTVARAAPFADLVHAGLLGFDATRVPLVSQAFSAFRYPLSVRPPESCVVRLAGQTMPAEEVAARFGARAAPPRRWRGHVEAERVAS